MLCLLKCSSCPLLCSYLEPKIICPLPTTTSARYLCQRKKVTHPQTHEEWSMPPRGVRGCQSIPRDGVRARKEGVRTEKWEVGRIAAREQRSGCRFIEGLELSSNLLCTVDGGVFNAKDRDIRCHGFKERHFSASGGPCIPDVNNEHQADAIELENKWKLCDVAPTEKHHWTIHM